MKSFFSLIILLSVSIALAQPQTFDRFFENKTLRVDYFHTGTASTELVGLDQAYKEGVWAGSRKNLIDTLNRGKYLVKVFDTETNQLIYSRSFSSIYGEWETTQEAQGEKVRSFHESVLVPFPKNPVQVVLAKRDKWMHFQDIFRPLSIPILVL